MQERVCDFVKQNGLSMDVLARYVDLVSEVGELGKEINKATDYGQCEFTLSEAWEEEAGDCLFALLALFSAAEADAQAALDKVLAKYTARMESTGQIGSDR